jgi:hypothetical protein
MFIAIAPVQCVCLAIDREGGRKTVLRREHAARVFAASKTVRHRGSGAHARAHAPRMRAHSWLGLVIKSRNEGENPSQERSQWQPDTVRLQVMMDIDARKIFIGKTWSDDPNR